MDRINHSTATPDRMFTAGSAAAAIPATVMTPEFANAVQEELCNVILGAELTLDPEDDTQLRQAIMRLIAEQAVSVSPATETVAGILKLSTQAQVLAGVGGGSVTPETLAGLIATLRMVPPGSVAYVAMSSAPTGWLPCNGALVSRTAYAALFAAIGTTYGVGDGSTTFGLPDLRGEFLRGWDNGRGVDSNRALGSNQLESARSYAAAATIQGGLRIQQIATPSWKATLAIGASPSTTDLGFTTGTALIPLDAAENRPRNVALLACIKY